MKTPLSGPIKYLSSFAVLFGFVGVAVLVGEATVGTMELPLPVLLAGVAAFAAMFVAGARGVARIDHELREWVAGDHPLAHRQVAENAGPVLVHWTYTPGEWAAYVEWERLAQKGDGRSFMGWMSILVGLMAFGVGLPLWGAALVAAGTWLWGTLTWTRSMAITRQLEPGDAVPSATLCRRAVLFHGRRLYLQDENSTIQRVRYVEGDAPHLLVVVHNRVGYGSPSLRIPVPRGREEEARAVAAYFPRAVPSTAHDAPAGSEPATPAPAAPEPAGKPAG